MEEQYKVFSYRWIILAATIPIIICTEMFWLTLAPISSLAEQYYGTSSFGISMFTTSYMIMYILFTLPASWVIDRFGFRTSLIIGSLITAVFGLLRSAFAPNFTVVMVCQFIIAIGQPFLLNISTKVPANWFPVTERSTASGLLTMAQYMGFIVPMVLSPIISASYGIPFLYNVYAAVAFVCAALAIIFTRERPALPPGPEAEKEDFSIPSVAKLFKNRNFIYVLFVAFISMGVFNALLTLIESILKPRGFTPDQAGIVGALFVIAGVIGAVLLPLLSDKLHRRIPFFIIGISLLVPLYLGITYLSNYILLSIVSAAAGFTIMGVAPILFQHGAEVAYPVKEGTSYGMILFMGQISGTFFVIIFEALSGNTGIITIPMLLFVAFTIAEIPITVKMKESDILKNLRNSINSIS
ncbi:MAG TPA: MFS transporter [Syntrophomonadaceae bacterium]|nr:MFS transporter [Syntrophomonadaceae bacterium]HNX29448.1 MFS transporter [Syntrophomonadaceae bacterium]HPR93816.1 MFS transporter [Syntrophomonadaceae bacterium]